MLNRRKEESEHTDYRQYPVFLTNYEVEMIHQYGDRWDIESGHKYQAVHGSDDLEELRSQILLLRIRLSPVLDLESR